MPPHDGPCRKHKWATFIGHERPHPWLSLPHARRSSERAASLEPWGSRRAAEGRGELDPLSGDVPRHRLCRSGNRSLNNALHLAARVQAMHPALGQAHYRRKLAEPKTSREALRSLKWQLTKVVYARFERITTGSWYHLTSRRYQGTFARLMGPTRPPSRTTNHWEGDEPEPRDGQSVHERSSATPSQCSTLSTIRAHNTSQRPSPGGPSTPPVGRLGSTPAVSSPERRGTRFELSYSRNCTAAGPSSRPPAAAVGKKKRP